MAISPRLAIKSPESWFAMSCSLGHCIPQPGATFDKLASHLPGTASRCRIWMERGGGDMTTMDLVLRGGRVIDPARGVDGTFDVGVRDGRIVEISPKIAGDRKSTRL